MKKLRIASILILLLLGFSAKISAQVDKNLPRKYSAEEQLLMLKNNALLVRLPNNLNKKKALIRTGDEKALKEFERELAIERKDIKLAFLQTYTFSNVYFYEDYEYEAVESGKLSGILRDVNDKVVPNEKLPNDYLIGSFGLTERLDLDAFVVMDKHFVQLDYPFPYYQRMRYFLSLLTYSKAEAIEIWNEKLFAKYRKWYGSSIFK